MATKYFNKIKQKQLLGYFAQAISVIHTVKNRKKLHLFTARSEHFATGRGIEKEVVDGLLHVEEVENKQF